MALTRQAFCLVVTALGASSDRLHSLDLYPGLCAQVESPAGASGEGRNVSAGPPSDVEIRKAYFYHHCKHLLYYAEDWCGEVTDDTFECIFTVLMTYGRCAVSLCPFIGCPKWCPCFPIDGFSVGPCSEVGYVVPSGRANLTGGLPDQVELFAPGSVIA